MSRTNVLKRYLDQEVIVFVKGTMYSDEGGTLRRSNYFVGIVYELDEHFIHIGDIEDGEADTSIALTEIIAVSLAKDINALLKEEVPSKEKLN